MPDEPPFAVPHAASHPGECALCRILDSIDLGLQNLAKDIGRTQGLLEASFGQIAARFEQVHAIAQGDRRAEPLNALRAVVDSLTVDLQFEDLVSQIFVHALARIDSISAALGQTRAIAAAASGAPRDEQALAALARSLESAVHAGRPGPAERVEGRAGSIDLF